MLTFEIIAVGSVLIGFTYIVIKLVNKQFMKTLRKIYEYMKFIERECQKCREWTISGRM